LPPGHAEAAGCSGELTSQQACSPGPYRLYEFWQCKRLKRQREQGIACKQGYCLTVRPMARRTSSPEIIVVHAREIIVDQ
jgi:hypothetical protein